MFPDAAVLWFLHYYLAKELNGLSVSAALARSSQVICALGGKKKKKSLWMIVHPGVRVLESFRSPSSALVPDA